MVVVGDSDAGARDSDAKGGEFRCHRGGEIQMLWWGILMLSDSLGVRDSDVMVGNSDVRGGGFRC